MTKERAEELWCGYITRVVALYQREFGTTLDDSIIAILRKPFGDEEYKRKLHAFE